MLSKLLAWARSDEGRQRIHDLGAALALLSAVYESLHKTGVL